ncbi:imidazole glycerol phosphate synthase subunit HisH [Gulosibacter molinativorax]|uniref:Imidazole glycerol phosphate synthase subunit HisH n=1 Tax=Gulosibacter molinativorax TaxID=256821 RepID=A0ABT7C8V2_9MICO|nr:imidazole glycerol phosphate synthase subunit HisH [Gulosibacter molinativorax]MDJ1371590.1 imidazole glycerol phosphate synthase subunit HisH [Gulosibacter molinativorax]QUY61067.1 Imidazole glycerol phosphate synthase subunit HisH [Gulosibacter molinativorax]
MSRPNVVVFDYGFGNVHSAAKALEYAGANVTLTKDSETSLAADGLLVPGVGSFAGVMEGLREAQGPRIIDQRLAGGRPVMGICVGMQVMFERGLEGTDPEASPVVVHTEETRRVHAPNADAFWWDEETTVEVPGTEGLDQWPGVVHELRAERLPHMGWNKIEAAEGSKLFQGIEDERFYFVHSFAATELVLDETIPHAIPIKLTYSTYGERFLAAVENGPLTATQFHPEKSGSAGIQLLRNWLGTL